ncbi:hypothetical protein BJ508DRAFT_417999 [Ascobolus immersus RN42]|uniref:BAG domain-containing protein n=1 Tax=Ascobolus immersus RN42 TaxID=1160509 RepID=A0A3N4HPJ0_ASCIM|nr:hypothetical protein BJ508DRAFT_417999 [Ascobolus immersus RN42]
MPTPHTSSSPSYLHTLDSLLASINLPPLQTVQSRAQIFLSALSTQYTQGKADPIIESPYFLPSLTAIVLGFAYLSTVFLRGSPSPQIKKMGSSSSKSSTSGKKKNKKAAQQSPPQPKPVKLTGSARIQQLRSQNETGLYPLIDAFISNPPAEKDKRHDHHTRLTETLMAVMLQLDAVETDGNPALRAERKEFVREMQARLDALDAAAKGA